MESIKDIFYHILKRTNYVKHKPFIRAQKATNTENTFTQNVPNNLDSIW